ncbi:MAG TPA: hypothetical protein VHW47_01990 [Acidimicrobiales bacterium]|nr:hypothetical protein [Acidimicrobiales bacterium]
MDMDTRVRQADPALGLPVPSGSSAEARWRYRQLTVDPGPSGRLPATRRAHRPGLHHRGWTAAVALSLAAVLAVALLLAVPGSGSPSAAAVLEQAAAAAGQQATLAPGQYLYTETQTEIHEGLYQDDTEMAAAVVGETDQSWIDRTGNGRHLLTVGTRDLPTAADEAIWAANTTGIPLAMDLGNGGRPQTTDSLVDAAGLPTDPTELAAMIAANKLPVHTPATRGQVDPSQESGASVLGDGRPYTVAEGAAALLIGPTTGMTPGLASALFQVLADQPDVRLLGIVTDHAGQQGQGVTLPTDDRVGVSEVVVDPTDGQLLEARFTLPPPALPPHRSCEGSAKTTTTVCFAATGTMVATDPMWTDVVARGVVGSTTATVPAAGTVQPTAALVPGAPTGLVATATPGGGVVLSWKAPVDPGRGPITDYVVQRVDQRGWGHEMSGQDTKSAATTYRWPYTDSNDPRYTVQAANADGYGPASAPAAVTP